MLEIFDAQTIPIMAKVLPILSLAIPGYLAGKFRLINKEGYSSLGNAVIYITMPALLFTSTLSGIAREHLKALFLAPLFGFFNILIMLLLTYMIGFIIRVPPERRATFSCLSSVSNAVYMGYPVIRALFGDRELTYAAVYDMGATLAIWTVVVYLLAKDKKKTDWRQIFNPCLVAVILAIAINLLELDIPQSILEPFSILGQATVPLAMIITGYGFSRIRLRGDGKDNYAHAGIVALIKLVLHPLLIYILLAMFPLEPTFKLVIIIISAMPSMLSTPVIVGQYGGDLEFAVYTVFFTTALSVLTVPLLISILR